MKTSSELMADSFGRARKHWQKHNTEGFELPKAPERKPLCVAISREAGAFGSEVARQVGEKLGWMVYENELLEKIAEQTGLQTELLDSVDERQTHWLTDCLQAFANTPHVSSTTYAHELARTIAGLAAHGDCVIVGRGAVALLPSDRSLRIRLVAELPDRVARISERLGVSEKEAKRFVQKKDQERMEFVKKHFNKDVRDASLFHLTVNTSHVSSEECAEIITQLCRIRQNH